MIEAGDLVYIDAKNSSSFAYVNFDVNKILSWLKVDDDYYVEFDRPVIKDEIFIGKFILQRKIVLQNCFQCFTLIEELTTKLKILIVLEPDKEPILLMKSSEL